METNAEEEKEEEVMNILRNENSYLMVIAIIRNSVNVNVKNMSRKITLLNTKSYIHCCFTKALYHALDFFTLCDQVKSFAQKKSIEIFNNAFKKREQILIWFICPHFIIGHLKIIGYFDRIMFEHGVFNHLKYVVCRLTHNK